jgi:hypothetical protein
MNSPFPFPDASGATVKSPTLASELVVARQASRPGWRWLAIGLALALTGPQMAAAASQLRTLLPRPAEIFFEDCFLQAVAALNRYSAAYPEEAVRLTQVKLSSGRLHTVATFTHKGEVFSWDAVCGVFNVPCPPADVGAPIAAAVQHAHARAVGEMNLRQPKVRRVPAANNTAAAVAHLTEMRQTLLPETDCSIFIVRDEQGRSRPVLAIAAYDQLGIYFPDIGTAVTELAGRSLEELPRVVVRAACQVAGFRRHAATAALHARFAVGVVLRERPVDARTETNGALSIRTTQTPARDGSLVVW